MDARAEAVRCDECRVELEFAADDLPAVIARAA
jgi:hypothetical protein